VAYLVLPSRRLFQPQGEVRVRERHWSTDRLVLAINWADGTGRNLANPLSVPALGANATHGASAPNLFGRRAATADNKLVSYDAGTVIASSNGTGTGDFTFLSYSAPTPSSAAQEALLSQLSASGTQCYLLANTGADFGGYSGRLSFGGYNAGTYLVASASSIFDGGPHVFVGSRNGTTYTIDMDGKEVATGTVAAFDMYFASGDVVTVAGISGYTTYTRTTPHFATLAFNRGLTADERKEFGEYPWLWLGQDVRRLYFDAAAGGGAVTGTATITPAAQTLTGICAVAVSGSATVTPAAQTATTAAAVAIAGTLTKTPNAQTATAAATVAVAATTTITPAAQTVSATGAVTSGVVGTASITPAAQTVTASGTVPIAATATITPSAQTATTSGAVQVAATATITPAAQTLTATGAVVSGVVGNAAITPAAQTATASGTVPIAATATVTPDPQTLSATAAVSGGAVTGTANVYVSAQTLVAAANIIVLGTATITPAPQTLLGLEAGTLPAEIPESSRTLSQMTERLGSEWVKSDPTRLGLATARRSRPRLG
jgi:hypothetical protein